MRGSDSDISRWLHRWRKDSEAKGFKTYENQWYLNANGSFKWPKKATDFTHKVSSFCVSNYFFSDALLMHGLSLH